MVSCVCSWLASVMVEWLQWQYQSDLQRIGTYLDGLQKVLTPGLSCVSDSLWLGRGLRHSAKRSIDL